MLTFPDIQRMVWAGHITYAQALAHPDAEENFLLNATIGTVEEFDALATRQHVTDPVRARIVRLARSSMSGSTSRDIKLVLDNQPGLTESELAELAGTLGLCVPFPQGPVKELRFRSAVTALLGHQNVTDDAVLEMFPLTDPRGVVQDTLVAGGHPAGAAMAVLRQAAGSRWRDRPKVVTVTEQVRDHCPPGCDLALYVTVVATTTAQLVAAGRLVRVEDVLTLAAVATTPART